MSKQIRLFLGASSVIATNMAELYAANGDKIILSGRNISALETTAQHIRLKYKTDVFIEHYDALNMASHPDFTRKILDLAGDMPLHIIALTGIMPEQSVMDNNIQSAIDCMNTNFTGLVSVIHPLANHLEHTKEGSIIMFGSVAGDRGRLSNYIYGATKAALDAYMSGLRNRLARSGIHAMTVKPGIVDTAMTRGMKLPPVPIANPADVAKHILSAFDKGCNTVYTPSFWRLIMLIIKLIPEFIFKKLKI